MDQSKHVIDTDAPPFVPEGWTVAEHHSRGNLTWDTKKVVLFATAEQQGYMPSLANDVHKAVRDKPVLNANVLDYILAHPELIPAKVSEWMSDGGGIFFWGTLYHDENFKPRVRCLCLEDSVYTWGSCDVMDDGLTANHPAALIDDGTIAMDEAA